MVIDIPAILDPFPSIAQHVEETKAIRLEFSPRRGMAVAIAALEEPIGIVLEFAPVHELAVAHIGMAAGLGAAVTPVTRRARARPRRVLPLRLRRQPVALARRL